MLYNMESFSAATAPVDGRAGWVGWEGVKESYQVSAAGSTLVLGVASGSRCSRLSALHAGSVWNGAVRLAQLIESGCLRFAGESVLELGAGAALPPLGRAGEDPTIPPTLIAAWPLPACGW